MTKQEEQINSNDYSRFLRFSDIEHPLLGLKKRLQSSKELSLFSYWQILDSLKECWAGGANESEEIDVEEEGHEKLAINTIHKSTVTRNSISEVFFVESTFDPRSQEASKRSNNRREKSKDNSVHLERHEGDRDRISNNRERGRESEFSHLPLEDAHYMIWAVTNLWVPCSCRAQKPRNAAEQRSENDSENDLGISEVETISQLLSKFRHQ